MRGARVDSIVRGKSDASDNMILVRFVQLMPLKRLAWSMFSDLFPAYRMVWRLIYNSFHTNAPGRGKEDLSKRLCYKQREQYGFHRFSGGWISGPSSVALVCGATRCSPNAP